MKNYQVTLSYKAVINVDVKANSEEEAKKMALKLFKDKERDPKWYNSKQVTLQDDTYKAVGVLDMDESWNML